MPTSFIFIIYFRAVRRFRSPGWTVTGYVCTHDCCCSVLRKVVLGLYLPISLDKGCPSYYIKQLQGSSAFNNAAADIKSITRCFENLFDIELGNVYNVFQEMRLRKKNRSSFLDLLRERLIQRMDEADEGY